MLVYKLCAAVDAVMYHNINVLLGVLLRNCIVSGRKFSGMAGRSKISGKADKLVEPAPIGELGQIERER